MIRRYTRHAPEVEDLYRLTIRRVPRHRFLDAATIEMLHPTDHYACVIDGLNLQTAVVQLARMVKYIRPIGTVHCWPACVVCSAVAGWQRAKRTHLPPQQHW
jgi:hypothetical protein